MVSSPTLTTVMMNEATSQGANKLPPYNVHWTTLNFYQQLLTWHEENLDDAHVTSELDKDALKIRFTSTHLYTAVFCSRYWAGTRDGAQRVLCRIAYIQEPVRACVSRWTDLSPRDSLYLNDLNDFNDSEATFWLKCNS